MGRPCSWTPLPYLYGVNWRAETAQKTTLAGEKFVHALMCHPYAPKALTAHDVGSDSYLVELGEDNTEQYATVDWNQLTLADQLQFTTWDRQVLKTMDDLLQVSSGGLAYRLLQQELDDLTNSASSPNLSPVLRTYMRLYVERDINHFNINGQIFQRPTQQVPVHRPTQHAPLQRPAQHFPGQWDQLTPKDQLRFTQWDRDVLATMNAMRRETPGTIAHYSHRQEFERHVAFATSHFPSHALRAYMKVFVDRDIAHFNLTGQIYQRP